MANQRMKATLKEDLALEMSCSEDSRGDQQRSIPYGMVPLSYADFKDKVCLP